MLVCASDGDTKGVLTVCLTFMFRVYTTSPSCVLESSEWSECLYHLPVSFKVS